MASLVLPSPAIEPDSEVEQVEEATMNTVIAVLMITVEIFRELPLPLPFP